MSPRWRRRLLALVFLAGCLAWPVSARTLFAEEPQGILGLSWLAILIEVANAWQAADVRKEQEEGGGEG